MTLNLKPLYNQINTTIMSINLVTNDQKCLVRGIRGLAKALGCCPGTAQNMKNSGRIPFMQFQRTVFFDLDKVLEALTNKK